jgi:glycerophosphoryl diester phosphodiesterase
MTLKEIRSLSMRDGNGVVHSGLQVPTLQEALQAIGPLDDRAPDRPFIADIHIKVYDKLNGDWSGFNLCKKTDYATLTRRTLEIVRAEGMLDRVFFTSFDERALDHAKVLEPSTRLGLLSYYFNRSAIKTAAAHGYSALVGNANYINSKDVELARELNLFIFIWFPDEEQSEVERFGLEQADGVVTDHLVQALSLKQSLPH